MFTLDPEWKAILTKAWSMKFIILSTLLSSLEVVVQMIKPDTLPVPNGTFAALAGAVTLLAGVARLLAQPGLLNGITDKQ